MWKVLTMYKSFTMNKTFYSSVSSFAVNKSFPMNKTLYFSIIASFEETNKKLKYKKKIKLVFYLSLLVIIWRHIIIFIFVRFKIINSKIWIITYKLKIIIRYLHISFVWFVSCFSQVFIRNFLGLTVNKF